MLEIKNIHRTYVSGEVETRVLRGISLKIPFGQFVSIIGPSGAGKSTLLYQMALLDVPSEGTVSMENKNITKLNQMQASRYRLLNFGFVFQEYALVPELNATENIALPLIMRGEDRLASYAVAQKILDRLDLTPAYEKLPSQLSGGEQQRVSVARAIAGKPKILFADEPTANLDSERSKEVLNTLQDLNKQGQTIVMITHELEYARLADRIIEIRDGVVVSDKSGKNKG